MELPKLFTITIKGVFRRSSDGRNGVLELDGRSIPGYILVETGPNNANAMYTAASRCDGIADCFLPLSTDFLFFRVPWTTLKAYLTDPNYTPQLLSPAGFVKSTLKNIIRNLGHIVLDASSHKIKLELELETIFVIYNQVKTIPMAGVVEDGDWANDIRQVCEKIKDTLPTLNDHEFDHFITELATSPSLGSAHLDSQFFWDEYRREKALRRFGQYAKRTPFMFHEVSMSPTLVLWRNQFSDDPKIGRIALGVSRRNRLAVSHPDYAAREIDCLLRFLSSSMDRFSLIYRGIFADRPEMIEYYEATFPHIMCEFYVAAKAAEAQKICCFY